MSGIGVIVMLIQTPAVSGCAHGAGWTAGRDPRAAGGVGRNINFNALAIAVATLIAGVLWPRRWTRYLPGPLVALIVGTLLGVLALRDVPVIGPVPTGLPQLAARAAFAWGSW